MSETTALLVNGAPKQKKHHEESHEGVDKKLLAFIVIGGLTLLYVLGELGVAIYVNSLVLLSDGFHNLGDVVALYIAFWSQRAKKRAFSDQMSYGWARTEILGGLTNGMFLISLCLYVVLESITKFIEPTKIDSGWLFVITAGAGLAINAIGTLVFLASGQAHGHSHSHGHDHGHSHGKKKKKKKEHDEPNEPFSDNEEKHRMHNYNSPEIEVVEEGHSHSHSHDKHKEGKKKKKHSHEHGHSHKKDKKKKHKAEDLNLKAVFLHYLGDTISSFMVLGAGLLLHFFPDSKWSLYVDPVSSLVIVVLILVTTVPLVKRCAMILLQSTPAHIDQDSLRSEITKLEGVVNVHDFHMWQLVDGMTITSVHIAVEEGCDFTTVVSQIKEIFHEHGIHSSAIQPEFVPRNRKTLPVCEQNCVDECEEDWCCKNALKNRAKNATV